MKSFKKCPRCNKLVAYSLIRCGTCGLNFNKFNSATNSEAKSAFRMGEKERVLYTKQVPSDVDKLQMVVKAIFGGWFGLHDFSVGKLFRGLFQVVGVLLGAVYIVYRFNNPLNTTPIGYLATFLGIIWAFSIVIWAVDTLAIIFNRYKYPVSLPYKNSRKKGE